MNGTDSSFSLKIGARSLVSDWRLKSKQHRMDAFVERLGQVVELITVKYKESEFYVGTILDIDNLSKIEFFEMILDVLVFNFPRSNFQFAKMLSKICLIHPFLNTPLVSELRNEKRYDTFMNSLAGNPREVLQNYENKDTEELSRQDTRPKSQIYYQRSKPDFNISLVRKQRYKSDNNPDLKQKVIKILYKVQTGNLSNIRPKLNNASLDFEINRKPMVNPKSDRLVKLSFNHYFNQDVNTIENSTIKANLISNLACYYYQQSILSEKNQDYLIKAQRLIFQSKSLIEGCISNTLTYFDYLDLVFDKFVITQNMIKITNNNGRELKRLVTELQQTQLSLYIHKIIGIESRISNFEDKCFFLGQLLLYFIKEKRRKSKSRVGANLGQIGPNLKNKRAYFQKQFTLSQIDHSESEEDSFNSIISGAETQQFESASSSMQRMKEQLEMLYEFISTTIPDAYELIIDITCLITGKNSSDSINKPKDMQLLPYPGKYYFHYLNLLKDSKVFKLIKSIKKVVYLLFKTKFQTITKLQSNKMGNKRVPQQRSTKSLRQFSRIFPSSDTENFALSKIQSSNAFNLRMENIDKADSPFDSNNLNIFKVNASNIEFLSSDKTNFNIFRIFLDSKKYALYLFLRNLITLIIKFQLISNGGMIIRKRKLTLLKKPVTIHLYEKWTEMAPLTQKDDVVKNFFKIWVDFYSKDYFYQFFSITYSSHKGCHVAASNVETISRVEQISSSTLDIQPFQILPIMIKKQCLSVYTNISLDTFFSITSFLNISDFIFKVLSKHLYINTTDLRIELKSYPIGLCGDFFIQFLNSKFNFDIVVRKRLHAVMLLRNQTNPGIQFDVFMDEETFNSTFQSLQAPLERLKEGIKSSLNLSDSDMDASKVEVGYELDDKHFPFFINLLPKIQEIICESLVNIFGQNLRSVKIEEILKLINKIYYFKLVINKNWENIEFWYVVNKMQVNRTIMVQYCGLNKIALSDSKLYIQKFLELEKNSLLKLIGLHLPEVYPHISNKDRQALLYVLLNSIKLKDILFKSKNDNLII